MSEELNNSVNNTEGSQEVIAGKKYISRIVQNKEDSDETEVFYVRDLETYSKTEEIENDLEEVDKTLVDLDNRIRTNNSNFFGLRDTVTQNIESIEEINKQISDLEEDIKNSSLINVRYADLVKLRNNATLSPGVRYRITDYITTVRNDYQEDFTYNAGNYIMSFKSNNKPFDIIVDALDTKTLSEDAKVCFSALDNSDFFFKLGANVSAWKIKYCLDNDTGRFSWADPENGKGVIYYMKDEFNNECNYDFRNIMFKCSDLTLGFNIFKNVIKHYSFMDNNRSSGEIWLMTHTFIDMGYINGKINNLTDGCFYHNGFEKGTSVPVNNRSIKNYSDKKLYINPNIFVTMVNASTKSEENSVGLEKIVPCNNVIGGGFNIIGPGCSNIRCDNGERNDFCYRSHNIKLGSNCTHNSIRDTNYSRGCSNIVFGDDCHRNSIIGNSICDITLGNSCSDNTINGRVNTLGEFCINNGIFTECNKLGNRCETINIYYGNGNQVGNDCLENYIYGHNNLLGNHCNFNNIGESKNNSSSQNYLGNSCHYNTIVSGKGNFLNNDCNYNTILGSYNSFGNTCNSNQLLKNEEGSGSSYNSLGNNCKNNIICGEDNSLGNSCSNNTLKGTMDGIPSAIRNSLGNGCTNNIVCGVDHSLGNGCESNQLPEEANGYSNKLDNNCSSNIVKGLYNNLGPGCGMCDVLGDCNSFGSFCGHCRITGDNNSLGNYCRYIKLTTNNQNFANGTMA